ncbi:MAG: hypothetical protein IJY85_03990 [Ruminococcus sp.]|nr:hypothetical protein [Ruminococcus sp.]
MKMDLKKPFSLKTCFRFALYGNICFIIFIIICLFYYYLFGENGMTFIAFDIAAYIAEGAGFLLYLLGIIGLCRNVMGCTALKALLVIYVLTEILLMLMDFQFIDLSFYNGQSVPLIITHAICSAVIALTHLTLERNRQQLNLAVIILVVIILGGMFSAALNFRVYGSIFMNAVGYIFFYARMIHLLNQEELEVACFSDPVRVTTYKSTFFDE